MKYAWACFFAGLAAFSGYQVYAGFRFGRVRGRVIEIRRGEQPIAFKLTLLIHMACALILPFIVVFVLVEG